MKRYFQFLFLMISCIVANAQNNSSNVINEAQKKARSSNAQVDFESYKKNKLRFLFGKDEKSAKAAFDELLLFANQNVPEAQGLLGNCYLHGIGTSPSIKDAVYWTKRGSEGNDLFSISELGIFYFEGLGVEKNNQEAIRLCIIAANSNVVSAFFALGMIYEEQEDFIQMEKWYKKACDFNHGGAYYNLALYYRDNQQEAKAVNILLKAVQLDNKNELNPDNIPGAFENMLGLIYDYGGNGVSQDLILAKQWYEKAIAKGNAKAALNLEDLKKRM